MNGILAAWFLVGIGLGIFVVWMIQRSVAQLRPEPGHRVYPRLLFGFFVRHILMALVLVFAIRHNALAGVAIVFGFWAGRWGMLLLTPGLLDPDG